MRTRVDITQPLHHYPYQQNSAPDEHPQEEVKTEPVVEQHYAYSDAEYRQYSLTPYAPESPYGLPNQAPSPEDVHHPNAPSGSEQSGPYEYEPSNSPSEPESDDEYRPSYEASKKRKVARAPKSTQLGPARKYNRRGEEEKNTDAYRQKRARNNKAVRLSRQKARDASNEQKQRALQMEHENEMLRGLIYRLKKDIGTYTGSHLFNQLPTLREVVDLDI